MANLRKSASKGRAKKSEAAPVMALSRARAQLPGLLKALNKAQGTLGISVHGEVQGYLVAREALNHLGYRAAAMAAAKVDRSALRGSLILVGDLAKGSRRIREELAASLERTWRGLK